MKRLLSAFAVFAALAALSASAAAPAARIVSVEEQKPLGRLSHFRGAGLSAFDQVDDMGDAGFSVRWYAAPPGAPEGTLLYAECMFARSRMPRTFFAPQREATEGYKTSVVTVPGAMVARYGGITSWQVTLSYRGTVLDRWVSPAGWTPVGELPQVGLPTPPPEALAPAKTAQPASAAPRPRQKMTLRDGEVPVRRPAVTSAAPAQVAPTAPRRTANPDTPVGWSPASPAPHVRRPLAIQPTRPATNATPRSLP